MTAIHGDNASRLLGLVATALVESRLVVLELPIYNTINLRMLITPPPMQGIKNENGTQENLVLTQ